MDERGILRGRLSIETEDGYFVEHTLEDGRKQLTYYPRDYVKEFISDEECPLCGENLTIVEEARRVTKLCGLSENCGYVLPLVNNIEDILLIFSALKWDIDKSLAE